MEETKQKIVQEVKAYARAVHVSPRKARLVAGLLRNLPVEEALLQLDFQIKRAADPITKLMKSAVANASHNFQIPIERLFVKSLTVDGGRVFFRYTPRAQGRALPIRKRTSHLNLILGVSGKPFKSKRTARVEVSKAKVKKTEEPEKAPKVEVQETVQTKAESHLPKAGEPSLGSRLKFWNKWRKKGSDPSQIPPKADPKGKTYTSFDRRGNM